MPDTASSEAAGAQELAVRLADFAVVLRGRNHNPSLINPDFLRIHEIVPKDLEPKEVVVVEPLARVAYAEGVTLDVIQERMQVREALQGTMPAEPLPVRIARRYAEVLPRIPYDAVGLNWTAAVRLERPNEWILANLCGPRARHAGEGAIARAQLVVEIQFADHLVNLTWSEASSEGGSAMRVHANFHHEKPPGREAVTWIGEVLQSWPKRLRWLERHVGRTVGGEG